MADTEKTFMRNSLYEYLKQLEARIARIEEYLNLKPLKYTTKKMIGEKNTNGSSNI